MGMLRVGHQERGLVMGGDWYGQKVMSKKTKELVRKQFTERELMFWLTGVRNEQ